MNRLPLALLIRFSSASIYSVSSSIFLLLNQHFRDFHVIIYILTRVLVPEGDGVLYAGPEFFKFNSLSLWQKHNQESWPL